MALQRIAELRAKLETIDRELNGLPGLRPPEEPKKDDDEGAPKAKVDDTPKAKEQAKGKEGEQKESTG